MGSYYILSNTLAWIVAVIFAYFANGSWVYQSTSQRGWIEAGAFVASRLFSLGLETFLLLILVDFLSVGANLSKILVSVLVVIVNYWTGLLVYRKGGH